MRRYIVTVNISESYEDGEDIKDFYAGLRSFLKSRYYSEDDFNIVVEADWIPSPPLLPPLPLLSISED